MTETTQTPPTPDAPRAQEPRPRGVSRPARIAMVTGVLVAVVLLGLWLVRATPWSAILAGMPILFGAGWLLARWHGGGWRTGIGVGIAYAAMDFLILLAFNALLVMPGVVLLSDATKLAAAALGDHIAGKS